MGVLYDIQKLLNEYNAKIEAVDKELVKRQIWFQKLNDKLSQQVAGKLN